MQDQQNDGKPRTPRAPDMPYLETKPWQNNPTLGPAFVNGAQVRDLTPEEERLFLNNIRMGIRKDLEQLPRQLEELTKPQGSPEKK